MRPLSTVAPEWWDYTTLNREILDEAARLSPDDLLQLARPGFGVTIYDTAEEFYLAQALEYIDAWRQAFAALNFERLPFLMNSDVFVEGSYGYCHELERLANSRQLLGANDD